MSRHKTGYVILYHGILRHDYRGIPMMDIAKFDHVAIYGIMLIYN